MEARPGYAYCIGEPCHRPDIPVLRDEGELHVTSVSK
jgi:hypothetical protein